MDDIVNYIFIFAMILWIAFFTVISFVFMKNKYLSIFLSVVLISVSYYILDIYHFNLPYLFADISVFINKVIVYIKTLLS